MTIPVDAIVGGEIEILAPGEGIRVLIERACMVPNPEFFRHFRLGRRPPPECPQSFPIVHETPRGIVVPRGAEARVRAVLAQCDRELRVVEDHRTGGTPARAPVPFPLRDYQREAVEAVGARGSGIFLLPTGTGKTRTCIGAIAYVRPRHALVVVPTTEIQRQWTEDLASLLGLRPDLDVAMVGGDDGHPGAALSSLRVPVVVVIDDSLTRALAKDPHAADHYDMLVVDEAHHCASPTYLRALRCVPARIRIGATATQKREDGLGELVEILIGPRLIERTTREMIAAGWLSPADVEVLETRFSWTWDGDPESPRRLAALDDALAHDEGRNATILDRLAIDLAVDETVLVLCGRTWHADALADALRAQGHDALSVHGKTRKRARREGMDAFRAGRLRCVVATQIANEGLDVRHLSRIYLVHPQSAEGATAQKLGRILRLYPGKKPVIVDVVDPLVPTLARRAVARRRVFAEAGIWKG